MVSRCFPGGYNVKLYISRGRLAWWLLAFLCCASEIPICLMPLLMDESISLSKTYVPIEHKSLGARPIFAGCQFFEICRSSADFLDLEPCRKVSHEASDGRHRETVRPPFDFIWKWPTFRPMPQRCPGDNCQAAQRWPSELLSIAAGRQWILRSSAGHRLITVRSWTDSLWVQFWYWLLIFTGL